MAQMQDSGNESGLIQAFRQPRAYPQPPGKLKRIIQAIPIPQNLQIPFYNNLILEHSYSVEIYVSCLSPLGNKLGGPKLQLVVVKGTASNNGLAGRQVGPIRPIYTIGHGIVVIEPSGQRAP